MLKHDMFNVKIKIRPGLLFGLLLTKEYRGSPPYVLGVTDLFIGPFQITFVLKLKRYIK